MRIDVVTLFPEMFAAVSGYGITGRAVERKLVELVTWNPRDFAGDRHRSVDDRAYGGGPGMVMAVEPLRSAIRAARSASEQPAQVACLTPQGRRIDQAAVAGMAQRQRLLLVCGRYEGIDERLLQSEVDEEWSLGDFVLSGGEIAAMAVVDAVTRLLPGALGHADSAEQDSFSDGLLDCPHYTRPEEMDGMRVPPVLLSGDHERIARWRRQQMLGRTWQRRPDLLEGRELDQSDHGLLKEFIDQQVHDHEYDHRSD